jgi:hypothetical protein
MPKSKKRVPKKRVHRKGQSKRIVRRIMKGCAKQQGHAKQHGHAKQQGGSGEFTTPTFQVGISKFYPMNNLASDVQRNMTVDRGMSGGNKKRRYSRKYLDTLRNNNKQNGGALPGLMPVEYKPSVDNSSPAVQPISHKFSDSNPYLV